MIFIHEMLQNTAIKYPDKEAFVSKSTRMTFDEMNNKSSAVASFLTMQGVKKDDRIGIFSSKCVEEIIAIFAIAKIGGTFVHINPHFREEQLHHIINNCDLKVVFIHETKMKEFKKLDIDDDFFKLIIGISSNIDLSNVKNSHLMKNIVDEPFVFQANNNISAEGIASIIYTSGSTGKSKGIKVTHKILYDATVVSASVLENTSSDRLISTTPFSFDGALSQLLTAVYVGGTLVLQESNFPQDIVHTLINEKITGFHAVPSLFRMLLQQHSTFMKHNYENLRYVSIIGEVFPADELMQLKSVLKNIRFYMMYGITEAFRSTFLSPNEFDTKYMSVGRPFPGVEIDIVDEFDNICSVGEVGEIVHKGLFISPGYWNNVQKTKEVFHNNALYTGDLGKKDENGYIYFMGRKDTMIKSMGYRICPDEIETYLIKMPEISESAVVGYLDKMGQNSIKAFVVCDKGIDTKDIISYCKKNLPYYMVPSAIEFMSEIPRTSNSKINRAGLF